MATKYVINRVDGVKIPVVAVDVSLEEITQQDGGTAGVIYEGSVEPVDYQRYTGKVLSELREACQSQGFLYAMLQQMTSDDDGDSRILTKDGGISSKSLYVGYSEVEVQTRGNLTEMLADRDYSFDYPGGRWYYVFHSPGVVDAYPLPCPGNYTEGLSYQRVLCVDNNNKCFIVWANAAVTERTGSPRYYLAGIIVGEGEWEYADDVLTLPEKPEEDDFMARYQPRIQSKGVGLYALSEGMLHSVIDDLWNTTLLEQFNNKMFGDAGDAILSLKYFYGLAPAISEQTTTKRAYMTIGNIYLHDAGAVAAIDREMVEYNYGSIQVPAYYGDHRDYTKSEYNLILPWVGRIQLQPDDVVGNTLTLKYRINLSDGEAVCRLTTNADTGGENLIFTSACTWGYDVPLKATGTQGFAGWAFEAVVNKDLSALSGSNYSTGSLSPNANAMGDLQAKLIIYRKEDLTEGNTAIINGKPCNDVGPLSSHTGYVYVEDVANAGTLPTRRNQEIVELLKGGVYV